MHNFPVLCWNMSENAVVAHLIGFEREFVGREFKSVKESIKNWLHEGMQDFYDYEPPINNARLRETSIKINASYRTDSGYFPIFEPIRIPIVAVYGDNNEYGYSKCYLPFLKKSFFYYDEKQLKGLIEHFVRDTLDGREPATIHRYIKSEKVWIDNVRVSTLKAGMSGTSVFDKNLLEAILHYAERLPARRALHQAANLFPETAWERGDVVNSISDKLQKQSNHLLVVGDAGTGKSVVLHEAIRKASRQVGSFSKREAATFWKTSSQRLIANARYLGEWQEQCDSLIDNLETVNGVLWIADLINLLTLGGESKEDSVAAYMLPKMAVHKLRLIAELNAQEYYAALQLFPEFIGHFQVIQVENLDEFAINRVAIRLQRYARENLNVDISTVALKLSQRLLNRFLSTEKLPGKLVRFLSRCIRESRQSGLTKLDGSEVLTTFIRQSGIPEIMIRDEILLSAQQVEDSFNRCVLHQADAIQALVEAVLVFKTGLNDPAKPIATLLFAGPTGVGKTAAAKALAQYFFGAGQQKNPLFQIDMSEFQHPSQINRLIGDEASPGKLTEHVRERPFSVILFDEIEKAHPAILDVLLGLFDEGLLVDRFGRQTDFRNCIFIMTSNLGVNQSNTVGFIASDNQIDHSKITGFFRPEFINRIDKIVIFNALNKQAIRDIARKELESLNGREGLKARKITLAFSEPVLSMIVANGFHPQYGARPMQRAIEHLLVSQISSWLLDNNDKKNCQLKIDYANNTITVEQVPE